MSAETAAAVVRRWEESGGVWRVVGRRRGELTVSLCQCTGGEEVDRIVSADPALLAFVGDRASSLD
ncbi:hypothetical protein AB3X52_19165 [Nocardioides sp. DS6]|uniref:DUF2188 domain-containing protein n=1 Tax=Nocardioides eburneus TaxID=3231482 RepID=A0ABV3T3G6_9ACTN